MSAHDLAQADGVEAPTRPALKVLPAPAEPAPQPTDSEIPTENSSPEPDAGQTPERLDAHARARVTPDWESPGVSDGEALGIGVPLDQDTGSTGKPSLKDRGKTAGDRIARSFRSTESGGTGLLRPPSLWTEPRPSLQEIHNRAKRLPWIAREDGAMRRLGQVWAYGVVFLVAVPAYYLTWAVETPTRFAVTVLTVALLILAGWLPFLL